MEQPAAIGRLNDDGTVTAIFLANDGGPMAAGMRLHEHYQDPAKVDALIALGSLWNLGEEIGIKHSLVFEVRSQMSQMLALYYDDVCGRMCDAWDRDDGLDCGKAHHFDSISRFIADYGCECRFLYLYVRGEWRIHNPDWSHPTYDLGDFQTISVALLPPTTRKDP